MTAYCPPLQKEPIEIVDSHWTEEKWCISTKNSQIVSEAQSFSAALGTRRATPVLMPDRFIFELVSLTGSRLKVSDHALCSCLEFFTGYFNVSRSILAPIDIVPDGELGLTIA